MSPAQVPTQPAEFRFAKQVRLRTPGEFRRVFEARVSAADDLLIVYGCPNALGHPRIGLTVSRKVGRAVERNRWKRLLREAFRLCQTRLPASIDLVVIPRPGAQPELQQLKKSLQRLAERIAKKWERRRDDAHA